MDGRDAQSASISLSTRDGLQSARSLIVRIFLLKLMPQRFLRPGINHSPRWNQVSHLAANLYIRLLTLVDDFGRCDGRPSVLWGYCFAVWNELNPKNQVKLKQVEEMLEELAWAALIEWYEVEGKKVVQISQWQERIREGSKSKLPENTALAASCCKLLLPSPSPSPSSSPVHQRHCSNGLRANMSEPQSDEVWLSSLKESPAYQGIDVIREHAKMIVWCRENKKQATRRRFIRWLNKVDKPFAVAAKRQEASLDPSKIELPERFKSWAGDRYHSRKDEIMAWRTWADVPGSLRQEWWREEKAKLPISI